MGHDIVHCQVALPGDVSENIFKTESLFRSKARYTIDAFGQLLWTKERLRDASIPNPPWTDMDTKFPCQCPLDINKSYGDIPINFTGDIFIRSIDDSSQYGFMLTFLGGRLTKILTLNELCN